MENTMTYRGYDGEQYRPETWQREEQLHQACVVWFRNEFLAEMAAKYGKNLSSLRKTATMLLHHNKANSASRVSGAMARALGVTRGIPDLELIGDEGRVVWVELKVAKAGARKVLLTERSEDQVEFANLVLNLEHEYYLIYSLEEFKSLVRWKTTKIIGKL